MPIRAENRGRYPEDWKQISDRIRFERAKGRCECEGECGMPGHVGAIRSSEYRSAHETARCANQHGRASVYTGSLVVLTTAHLNHTPEDCRDENLKAMCQGCHLWYDREHHAETARATRDAQRKAAGMVPIDGIGVA